MMLTHTLLLLSLTFSLCAANEYIVLTNDDGWAVAQIRAAFEAFREDGWNIILSSPAENWSGSGSLSVPAMPRRRPCEFDACPANSPAYGRNTSNVRLNYVNAAPSDAAYYGVTALAAELWGPNTRAGLVVSGPNVGHNVGYAVFGSGTIGAAARASLAGIPAIAFSGSSESTQHEPWTALTTSPRSRSVRAARAYASLAVRVVTVYLASSSGPRLPPQIILSVNLPALSAACRPDDVEWVLTRALPVRGWGKDVETCGNGGRLPLETAVVGAEEACYASVSVLDARTKTDARADAQAAVLARLGKLEFSCFEEPEQGWFERLPKFWAVWWDSARSMFGVVN